MVGVRRGLEERPVSGSMLQFSSCWQTLENLKHENRELKLASRTILTAMSSSTAGDPQFHTTQWSLVVVAAASTGEVSQSALADLCQAYWYPLYAFLRRRGNA